MILQVELPVLAIPQRAEAATAWNNTDWPYSVLLTVDHTKVGSVADIATTTYSTAGTYSYTVPQHSSITVYVWGGGGGGGGATANNGSAGGQSSFNGTVIANGGSGGTANDGAGGSGGTASGGDTNTTGTSGTAGSSTGAGGAGASGGSGGTAASANTAGNVGTAPGGGGSGGHYYYTCGKGCFNSLIGGGGGGGGYSKKTYSAGTLTPGSSITVVVGAVGAKGAAGTYAGGDGAVGRVVIAATPTYSNVENFPVYVNLADMPSEFWTYVRSDCGDIRVVSSNGAPEVPREVVTCNTGAQTGELWFKAPLLSGVTDMPFYIYYGNSSATDYAATETFGRNNVWTNGYAAVWHLKDGTTLSGTDATSNTNTGTAGAGATAVTGKLNGGADFAGSSTSYIEAAHSASLSIATPLTLSAWVYLDGYGGASNLYIRGIMSKYLTTNAYFIRVGNGVSGSANYLDFGGATHIIESTNFPLSQWVYVTGTTDASGNGKLFRDGNQVLTGTVSIGTNTENVRIGEDYSSGANDRNWDGKIDEARVSNVERTPGWIKTEYNNQNSPSTFYSDASFTSPSRVIRLLGNVRLRGVRLR